VRGIGDGEHAVGLDVELFLRAGLVLPSTITSADANAASTSPLRTP
jgi:hypothetical protein